MKTSELIGPALDWAVAKCEGRDWPDTAAKFLGEQYYKPSTDWSQGGLIIERERIKVDPRKGIWEATVWNEPRTQNASCGPTPLIAAMRCYVASRLGDDVEIPK